MESRFPLFLRATYSRAGASAPPPPAHTCCCVVRAGTPELEGPTFACFSWGSLLFPSPNTGQTRGSGANSLSSLPWMHPPVHTSCGCCCQNSRYLMLLPPNLLRLRFVCPRTPGAFQSLGCALGQATPGPRPLAPPHPQGGGVMRGERYAPTRLLGLVVWAVRGLSWVVNLCCGPGAQVRSCTYNFILPRHLCARLS